MKDVLLKLANNENEFDCDIFGERRKCKIIKLDLWGLDEGKGMALVHFDEPVKKTERREVDRDSVWGLDRDDSLPMHDVVVDSYEEWITIGY
jgi:hypothetical protein